MDFITILLSSIGGVTTILCCFGFLGKAIINSYINKAFEKYKNEISHKNSEALERLKSELQLYIKAQDRTIESQIIMDRYRGPLLHAANDLQSRIYNLTSNYAIDIYFVNNHGDGSERDYFIKNTSFLIAQYFAWTEIIRREIQFIEFDNIDSTKGLAILQAKICSNWQGGSRNNLSIWAGEQRAIGELMIENINGRYQCIGYSTFLKLLNNNDGGLLNELESRVKKQLESQEKKPHRLISIQNSLIDVIYFLDPDNKRFNPETLQKISGSYA
ncbi:hypothetical protein ACK36J_19265 [Aeromonas veronii]|uniref:hypothetical protein n=1 Tax=Aeromonas veronii TaxID=654 RepID=UPI0022302F84|nr:hypothetical protein [Aeromonas veronii]UZE58895.1 hypothetical protein ONR73_18820 [Aeromonas veronii]